MTRPLVVGVGNRDRGDDGVGPMVIDALRADGCDRIDTVIIEGDLSDLALRWDPDRPVVVIDAMSSGREPGMVEIVDGATTPLDQDRRPVSSHGVGLGDAIALARALGRLPNSLTVVLIEGATFEHGRDLTDEVSAAGLSVATRLPDLLAR